MTPGTVAIVGGGRMGGAFARHLVAAGHPVVVVDPDPERRDQAAAAGATTAERVTELGPIGPDPVLLSLPTEAAFVQVVDDLAALTTAGWHPVVVDTSTLAIAAKETGTERLAAAGMTLLDCPVSGTGAQADAGDVVVYASGPTEAIERCRPVLATFARAVHDVGPFGAGSKLKYVANLLVGAHTVAAAEALALAERAGMDPDRVLALLLDGAGRSRMLEVRGPAMVAAEGPADYGQAATIDVYRKDLAIILGFAAEVGAATPLLDQVAALYQSAADRGLGSAELAAVHHLYRDRDR